MTAATLECDRGTDERGVELGEQAETIRQLRAQIAQLELLIPDAREWLMLTEWRDSIFQGYVDALFSGDSDFDSGFVLCEHETEHFLPGFWDFKTDNKNRGDFRFELKAVRNGLIYVVTRL